MLAQGNFQTTTPYGERVSANHRARICTPPSPPPIVGHVSVLAKLPPPQTHTQSAEKLMAYGYYTGVWPPFAGMSVSNDMCKWSYRTHTYIPPNVHSNEQTAEQMRIKCHAGVHTHLPHDCFSCVVVCVVDRTCSNAARVLFVGLGVGGCGVRLLQEHCLPLPSSVWVCVSTARHAILVQLFFFCAVVPHHHMMMSCTISCARLLYDILEVVSPSAFCVFFFAVCSICVCVCAGVRTSARDDLTAFPHGLTKQPHSD